MQRWGVMLSFFVVATLRPSPARPWIYGAEGRWRRQVMQICEEGAHCCCLLLLHCCCLLLRLQLQGLLIVLWLWIDRPPQRPHPWFSWQQGLH